MPRCCRYPAPRLPGRAAWNAASCWARSGHAGAGSRAVGGYMITDGCPESREIAKAVEDVALVPDAPGLVELAHCVVPALAGPGRIVATHKAKHIPGKSGTGELGLEVAHDSSILGQLGLRKAVWLRR